MSTSTLNEKNKAITFAEHKTNGSALCFKLINEYDQTVILFFNQEYIIEYILSNHLIITRFDFEPKTIRVFYKAQKKPTLILKRIEKKDFRAAASFIKDNLDKFKPKYTWRGRLLSDMALNGLTIGKWLAYAYWTDQNKIISYLDYKLRVDGSVEIGIQLTDTNYQNQGLATSLICLLILANMSNRILAGTFEKNLAMCRVFQNCGFLPYMFYDPETQTRTNKVKERIDIDRPNDKSALTNSVYFYTESLLEKLQADSE